MARPIEYDKNEVLTNAMGAFWQYGYEATSMKELVQATGLTTRSMYNVFGSKKGVFYAALNWYYNNSIKGIFEVLKQDKELVAIRNFVIAIADFLDDTNKQMSVGCLFTNTMSEKNTVDDDNYSFVNDFFEELEVAFYDHLLYAKKQEMFKGNCTIKAKQLVTLIQGLSIYSKNNESDGICHQMVDDFLKMLNI